MADPITPILAEKAIAAAVDRLLKDQASRRELVRDSGIFALPRPARKVAQAWVESDNTIRQLLTADPLSHNAALDDLRARMATAGVDEVPDLAPIVDQTRTALRQRRPVSELLDESTGQIVGELRELRGSLATTLPQDQPPLPPRVQSCLDRVPAPVRPRLTELLIDRPSAMAYRRLLKPGSLLEGAPAAAWEAAARMAHGHGHTDVSALLWDRVVQVTADPARALAWQAYVVADTDGERARELAAQAAMDGAPFPGVVDATLREDHDAAIALRNALDLVDPDHAVAAMLIVQALGMTQAYDDAVVLGEQITRDPERADGLVQLAGVLLTRAQAGKSSDRTGDLNRAAELALRGRDLRYRWGLDARQATWIAIACAHERADMADVDRIAEAARTAGHPDDLERDDTAELIALAGIAQGRTHVDVPGLSPAHRRLFSIVQNDLTGRHDQEDGEGAVSTLLELLDGSKDDGDRARVLLALARRHAVPAGAVEDLEEREPQAAAAVRTAMLVTEGKLDQAVAAARRGAVADSRQTWQLANVLDDAGRHRALVDLAVDAWPRFHDVALANFALGAARSVVASATFTDDDEAVVDRLRDVARQAAARSDLTGTQRHRLLRNLFSLALALEDWEDATGWGNQLYMSGIDQEEADTVRVAVAQAHINAGWPRRAWDSLQDGDHLPAPPDAPAAQMIGALAATFSTRSSHVNTLLDHAERASDSMQVAGYLTINAWQLAGRVDDEHAEWAAMTAVRDFVDRYPDNPLLTTVSSDELASSQGLHTYAPAVPTGLVRLAERIENGLGPLAYLTAISSKPYSELLITGEGRAMHTGSSSLVQRQMDRHAAAAALDGPAVLDITALYLVALLDVELGQAGQTALSERLTTAFGRVLLPNAAALDLAAARAGMHPRSTGVIVPPTRPGGRHRIIDLPEEVLARRFEILDTMERIADTTARVARPSDSAFLPGHEGNPNVAAATAALDIAVRDRTPAWVDDGHARAWLRRRSMPSFDTHALLQALHQRGDVTPAELDRAVTTLRRARAVLLPTPAPDLHAHVAAHGVALDGAGAALSEPGWWLARSNLGRGYIEAVFRTVAATDPAAMPDWMHALTVGLHQATDANVPARILVHLLQAHPALRPHASLMAWAWANAAETCSGGLRPGRDELKQAVTDVQRISHGRLDPEDVALVESLDPSEPPPPAWSDRMPD